MVSSKFTTRPTPTLLALENALEALQPDGQYATEGVVKSFPFPGLVIDGIGDVGLPLPEDKAQAIFAHHGAPDDASVVALDSANFRLENPDWAQIVDDIVVTSREKLGIPARSNVAVTINQLLVRRTGASGVASNAPATPLPTGGFAKLVIVLPGRFQGGGLVVHHASNQSDHPPFVWEPAAAGIYHVKFAAFYGECQWTFHDVQAGYELCLVYDLVTRDTAIPKFVGADTTYKLCRSALKWHFAVPGPSTGYSGACKPLSKFVYVLGRKYPTNKPYLDMLEGKDLVVAKALTRFCEESEDEFVLYLTSVTYKRIQNDDDSEYDHNVMIGEYWSKCSQEGSAVVCSFEAASAVMSSEVAPTKCFEDVTFDTTKTTYRGSWQTYTTAALVVLPLRTEMSYAVESVETALTMFEHYAKVSKPTALAFAHIFFVNVPTFYSIKSREAISRLLPIITSIGYEDGLKPLLAASYKSLAFSPQLGESVRQFGWDFVWKTAQEIGKRMDKCNGINLLCSILHDNNNVDEISQALSFLEDLQSGRESDAEELTRLLTIAYRVSPDAVLSCVLDLHLDNRDALAPAFVQFLRDVGSPSQLLGIATTVKTEMYDDIPQEGTWDLHDVEFGCSSSCSLCSPVRHFLKSSIQMVYRLSVPAPKREHVQGLIISQLGDRVTWELERRGSPHSLIITKTRTVLTKKQEKLALAVKELGLIIEEMRRQQQADVKAEF